MKKADPKFGMPPLPDKPFVLGILPWSDRSGNADTGFNIIINACMAVPVSFDSDGKILFRYGKQPEKNLNFVIQEAALLIADITDGNSNVMYRFGLALAFNKPVICIAKSGSGIPSDVAGFPIYFYDTQNLPVFVERLSQIIKQALATPESFLPTRAIAQKNKRHNVFISYSHTDQIFLDRLLVHLKPLERDGLIDLWVDTKLRAGDRWKKEIEAALDKATVAILLVSADFLASDFITKNELPPILLNAQEKGTKIVPVIVKPCRFARDKNLRDFHAINDPKRAVILLSSGEQELIYDSVSAEVERLAS